MNKKVLVFLIVCILLPFGMVKSPVELASHVAPLWINYYTLVGVWAYTSKPIWQAFLACYGIASFGIIGIYFGIGGIQFILGKLKNYFEIESAKNRRPITEIQTAFQSILESVENHKKFSMSRLYLRCLLLSLKAVGIFFLTLIFCWYWPIRIFFKKRFSRPKRRKPHTLPENQEQKPIKKKNHKNRKFTKWLKRQSVWIILLFLFIPFPYTDPAAAVAMRLKGVKHGLWYLLIVNIFHVYFIVFLVYSGIKLFLF